MSNQTRQQRRAEARRREKQGARTHSMCTCGSAIPNPTPDQMADIRAYLHIEHGVTTVEELHDLIAAHSEMIDIHNRLAQLSSNGVATGLLDEVVESYTGEVVDMLEQLTMIDPDDADVIGLSKLGDPAEIRSARIKAENAYIEAEWMEYQREAEALE